MSNTGMMAPVGRALISASLLLSSCLPNGDRSDSTAPIVVRFTHGKLSGDQKAFSTLLREYEREHPGVAIREEVLPASTDQQHQFYAINLEGKSPGFDLLAVDVIWVQEFAKAGWLQPLDHLLPAAERQAWFPSALEAATFDGRPYAVPWYMDAGVLFYRQDLLSRHGFEPPRTWPELLSTARAIMERERDPKLAGFIWQGKQYEGLICSALEFVWSHGGDLDMSRSEATEAGLAFMRRLVADGISPAVVATADEEAARHMFGAGRAVFMRNWPYVWALIQRIDSPLRGEVGMMALPSLPGRASASVLGGWMLAVPRGAERPKEAADLVRFLTGEKAQRRMARDLGYKPSRRSLYQDAELLRDKPELTQLYPIFLSARPRPVTPYYLMLSQAWQPELSAVVVGRKSPEEAMDSARRQLARVMGMSGIARASGREGSTPP